MWGTDCVTWATILLLALVVTPSVLQADSSVLPGGSLLAADVAASPAPALELMGRWHGGPVYASAVSGDYVYFGTGGGIRSLKIGEATQHGSPSWQEATSMVTSGVVRDLAASGIQ